MNMPLSMKYLFFISFLEAFFLQTLLQARLWETSKRAGQLKAEGLHPDCHFEASRSLCFLELAQKTRALAQKEAQKKPCNTKICLDPRLDLSFPNIGFNEPINFKKPMSTTIFLSQLTRFLFQKTHKSFGSFLKEKPNVRRHGEGCTSTA